MTVKPSARARRSSPLTPHPLFVLSAAALVACGQGSSGASSASASAAPPKSCSEELPQDERTRRCEGGEGLCCTAMLRGIPKTAPDYFDKIALACKNGSEAACEAVRDSDRDATYKLDALEPACSKISGWSCRTAAMLAVLVAPDRAPKAIATYCRQTGDADFRIGQAALDCKKVDPAALAALAPDADACRAGDLAGCKALAGVDGGARGLYDGVAWNARGLAIADADKGRVKPTPLDAADAKGRVAVRVEKGDADVKALAKALDAERDTLRRCVGAIDPDAPLGGAVRLEVVVDRTGRIATTRYADAEPERLLLPTCLRGALQDVRVGEPGPALRKAVVVLTPSR